MDGKGVNQKTKFLYGPVSLNFCARRSVMMIMTYDLLFLLYYDIIILYYYYHIILSYYIIILYYIMILLYYDYDL